MKVAKTLVPIFCDYASKPFKFIANTKAMKTFVSSIQTRSAKRLSGFSKSAMYGASVIGTPRNWLIMESRPLGISFRSQRVGYGKK